LWAFKIRRAANFWICFRGNIASNKFSFI
jgi:hypothetical protein